MKEVLRDAAWLIGAGILIVTGFRVGELIFRPPETRIVICFANELDQVEICKPVSELLKKKGIAS